MHARLTFRTRRALPELATVLVVASLPAACGQCGADPDTSSRAPDAESSASPGPSPVAQVALEPPPRLTPPAVPAFVAEPESASTDAPRLALPPGCEREGPDRFASLPAEVHPVVRAPDLDALALIDDLAPPQMGGVATTLAAPQRPQVVALPTFEEDLVGSRAPGGLLFAWTRGLADAGPLRELLLLDTGGAVGLRLGEGDGLRVADARCGPWGCGVLTTRLGRVRAAGAEVFLRPATEAGFRHIALETNGLEESAPLALAAEGPPFALVAEGDEAVSFELSLDGPPAESSRLTGAGGVVAALAGKAPVLLAYEGNPSISEGCAPAEGVRLVRGGGAEKWPGPTAPVTASLDPIAGGVLATYLVQLRCDDPRKVLYGAVLRADGADRVSPVPIADADAYAVAARDGRVDLWLWSRAPGATAPIVRWVSLGCSAPGPSAAPADGGT